jgi:hypothetical protein
VRRRVAARTSVKRYARHSLGLKAPRGMGWVTNPKKAAYNRVYNRTSVSVDRLFKPRRRSRSRSGGCLGMLLFLALLVTMLGLD